MTLLARRPPTVCLVPRIGLPKRMALPEILRENFVEQIVRIVFLRFDLLHDHLRSRLMSSGLNRGCRTRSLKTSKAVSRCSSSTTVLKLTHSLAVKASRWPPMESTERAICFGAARFGPLEDHVLDKMGNPVSLRPFLARAGVEPDPHGTPTARAACVRISATAPSWTPPQPGSSSTRSSTGSEGRGAPVPGRPAVRRCQCRRHRRVARARQAPRGPQVHLRLLLVGVRTLSGSTKRRRGRCSG